MNRKITPDQAYEEVIVKGESKGQAARKLGVTRQTIRNNLLKLT